MRLLFVYASEHGQTERIAERAAAAARDAGAAVEVREVHAAEGIDLAGFDAVAAGGSIHAGHHQRALEHWVKHHATALSARPSAFFSVSLTAAEDTGESREATRAYIDGFLDETGWTPARTVAFAGALQYREYDFVTRLLMRLIMRRGGHPTDTSRDYDYTDWAAVERFGRDCAQLAAAVPHG